MAEAWQEPGVRGAEDTATADKPAYAQVRDEWVLGKRRYRRNSS